MLEYLNVNPVASECVTNLLFCVTDVSVFKLLILKMIFFLLII